MKTMTRGYDHTVLLASTRNNGQRVVGFLFIFSAFVLLHLLLNEFGFLLSCHIRLCVM